MTPMAAEATGISTSLLWVGFAVAFGIALAIDLAFTGRKGSTTLRPIVAARFTALWVGCAIAFGVGLELVNHNSSTVEYFTGYLVEYSLSIDNVFVFTIVFAALKTPPAIRQRALIFGILISLALRLGMILIGAAVVEQFSEVLYLFGAFLLFTGFRMLRSEGESEGESRFVRLAKSMKLSPLGAAVVVIGFIDLVFAVDSIPAIFGITKDPFIVFTSNAFAILGLRSLYFLLADAKERFHYLSTGLSFVLMFIGAKMLLPALHYLNPELDIHLPPIASLLAVLAILGMSIALSLARPPKR